MGQWRKNLNARQRRNSRNPAYKPKPSAAEVVAALPVTELPPIVSAPTEETK